MHLQRLVLHDFRNIQRVDIEPSELFNIFWGENGQGKTNILEAISLLGTLKSFRGARNSELVNHGCSFTKIGAEVEQKGTRRRIELVIEEQGKRAQLDGKDIRSAGDFFGRLNPVLFSPDELSIGKGPPSGRRNLLDRALFQTDVTFLSRVRDYDRHLKQRNMLLREGRTSREIDPWTEGLIRTGALLRNERLCYVRRIAEHFRQIYRRMSGGEEADLRYSQEGESLPKIKESLEREFAQVHEKERHLRQTLAGPHRDDLLFAIEGKPVRLYASQGQQRSILLSFKTAQIMDLETITGESPVLLLDDMTSELDRKRQTFFFDFLLSRRGQVFITTTDAQPLMDKGFEKARLFRVDKGALHHDAVE